MRQADCPTAKTRKRMLDALRVTREPVSTVELKRAVGNWPFITRGVARQALLTLAEAGAIRKIRSPEHRRGTPVRWELVR